MSISKTATRAGVTLAIIMGSMLAVNATSAHNGGGNDTDKSERISALAEKLGVEESAVEGAFSELKEEHKAEREAERAEHVAGLVTVGTLTQEQADELTALKDGFKAEAEALKESGAERDEIKTLMKANRAEIEAWADAQGINLDDIKPERGEGEGRRGHGHRGGDHKPGADAEDSSQES